MPADLTDAPLTVTAFDWVPPFAQGLVRDLRVRWALKEAALPYEVELLAMGTQGAPAHLARQPFGQVPVLTTADTPMFESGAILWRIAEASGGALLPEDAAGRTRTLSWVFAALNTVEPPILMYQQLNRLPVDKAAAETIEREVRKAVERRLGQLQAAMEGRDWLAGAQFTVADLLMATVLRGLRDTPIVSQFPKLDVFLSDCTARPAFTEALAEQMAPFAENAARYAAE
ncbi:glutathione S-transferase family protein [Salipiger mangrovisoli]|uniref:Glutathione S-transferase family protein n=1 Tax=Salipiger mangrovisoli TaxID=2865933 RepID=A0ABR9WVM1_9RHOB|nr:glutathione S-transferase family protein [Salipiger mangrovisoli]MBE9635322.1 glutathione S-transferase family protein [Salipiger mangrovisoli]